MVVKKRNSVLNVVIVCTVFLFALPLHAQEPDPPAAAENSATSAPAEPGKRLFGVIPNYRTVDASIPFSRLSAKQKLNIARHDSFDWPNYIMAAALTFATPSSKDQSASYGGGVDGFLNRYARSTADQITGNMLTEGFMPVILHQDPRYFRPGTGSFGSRLASALSQIVVSRSDAGHRTFNASEWLGNAMAVGISNTYSPNLNSWSARTQKWMLMVSTDTFSNVMKEFGPDLRERLLPHRHKSK
jgi:hypothetical protein